MFVWCVVVNLFVGYFVCVDWFVDDIVGKFEIVLVFFYVCFVLLL